MSASTKTSSSGGACVRSGAKLIATNTEVADMLNRSALVNGLGRDVEVLERHDISRHHVVLVALVNVVLGEEVVHRYRELQGRHEGTMSALVNAGATRTKQAHATSNGAS